MIQMNRSGPLTTIGALLRPAVPIDSGTLSTAPKEAGAYAVMLHLAIPVCFESSRLAQTLNAGWYVYAGSAYGPGGVSLEVFEVSDTETKAWADTVLVSGIALLRGAYQNETFEHRARFLVVYRHQKGCWKLVASSVTDVV